MDKHYDCGRCSINYCEGYIEYCPLHKAAPELLEAAQLGLHEAESCVHDQLDGTSSLERQLELLEPIRKAIANAGGE